jgi:predicted transposase/invertase (TIGR01784 family)
MIGIKDEKELEKYSKKMNNAIIKESVDNLKRLNSDAAFVYGLTPEEDEMLVRNTRDELVRREALAEGLAEGEAKGKAEGLAEGKAEGNEKIKQIATNLLKKDYSIDEIVEITGLAKEEIEKIISSL